MERVISVGRRYLERVISVGRRVLGEGNISKKLVSRRVISVRIRYREGNIRRGYQGKGNISEKGYQGE